MALLPVRAVFADREKIVKVWSVVVAVAAVVAVVAGVVAAARMEVAVLVMVTMAVVLVSPPILTKPFATVLFHFVLKLIFSENKKTLKNS